MKMLVKLFETLKNNWKKTVFFTGVSVYGVRYGQGVYRDSLLRVKYCEEAKEYGIQPVYQGERPRRITVFLNPAANGGKSRKMFEKNVAPLLFLAGIEVTTIKTEHEGQAKKFMEVLEDTDAIVVAGGNGLLLEVITGLLKRPDQERFSKIPIGVIPVGRRNTLANSIYKKGESAVEWMAELGMSIVKGTTRPIDVMHLLSNDGKSVYAVDSLTWGAYEDAEERKSKYWFLGPLKHRFTYIKSVIPLIGFWPANKSATFSYGSACAGCSKCYVAPAPVQRRWTHAFSPPVTSVVAECASRDNPECGIMQTEEISSIEFQAKTCNGCNQQREKNCLQIAIGPKNISRTEFIKEGWARMKKPGHSARDKLIEASLFKISPHLEKGKDVFYSIDHEQYDAMQVEVTLLKNKLNVFCPTSS